MFARPAFEAPLMAKPWSGCYAYGRHKCLDATTWDAPTNGCNINATSNRVNECMHAHTLSKSTCREQCANEYVWPIYGCEL